MAKKQMVFGYFHRLSFMIIVWMLLRSNKSVTIVSASTTRNGNALQLSSGEEMFEKSIKNTPKVDQAHGDGKNVNSKLDVSRKEFIDGYGYSCLNKVKRAPSGFIGMRGKKFISKHDEGNTNAYEYLQMRNDQRYKKAPTAFYGVRGKKIADDLKRWQDLMQKIETEQVQEILLKEFIEHLMRIGETNNELIIKRAPNGFTGVRGKRPDYQKSQKSKPEKYAIKPLTGIDNNSFSVIRGKRSFLMHNFSKRSPWPSVRQRKFFDFWKKSSYGDSRRQRFVDFGNKFVAVRGKKSSYPNLNGEWTRDTNAFLNNHLNNRSFWLSNMDEGIGKPTPNTFIDTNKNMVEGIY
uniref:Tachykinin n=1 Tax=Glossina pallidipes TaxID=7398 RepID=A0A1A9ZNU5_GLOPL